MIPSLYLFNIIFYFISATDKRDHYICFLLNCCLVADAFGEIGSEKEKLEQIFFIFFHLLKQRPSKTCSEYSLLSLCFGCQSGKS